MPNLSFAHQHTVSLRDSSIDTNGMNAYIIKDGGNTPFKFIPSTETGKHLIRTDLDINIGDIIETNYFGNRPQRYTVNIFRTVNNDTCSCYMELELTCSN